MGDLSYKQLFLCSGAHGVGLPSRISAKKVRILIFKSTVAGDTSSRSLP